MAMVVTTSVEGGRKEMEYMDDAEYRDLPPIAELRDGKGARERRGTKVVAC